MLVNTILRNKVIFGKNDIYIEWCSRKRRKWNNKVISRGVATERNKRKYR
jgi:hypothetical protein